MFLTRWLVLASHSVVSDCQDLPMDSRKEGSDEEFSAPPIRPEASFMSENRLYCACILK